MKTIWLSALQKDESAIQQVMAKYKTYGLELQGHFWQNDNPKLAWLAPREEMLDGQVAVWAIMGSREDFEKEDIRFGLSMLAITVQARKGIAFPMAILQTAGDPLTEEDLPTTLQRADILPAADAGTAAKMVAKVHAPAPKLQAAFHLDMVGNEQLGLWLEVFPTGDPWPGIIFGVDDGEIAFQAVGEPGQLPKTSTLNYAMQGLKLELAEKEFTAWATQNEISAKSAYFIKISGAPGALLFGPYSEAGAAELYTVRLS
jgi:hypothetical protein